MVQSRSQLFHGESALTRWQKRIWFFSLTLPFSIVYAWLQMICLSTREAARKLGLSASGLSKYIRLGRIPAPAMVKTGGSNVHAWTEDDIERVRKLLPKIANGRKTRYRKKKKPQAKKPLSNKWRK